MANAGLGEKAEDDDELPDLEPVADSAKKVDEEEDDGEVSEGDVDPKEIELVMNQTSCSRKKAIKALKDSGGDIINASTSGPSSSPLYLTDPFKSWLRLIRTLLARLIPSCTSYTVPKPHSIPWLSEFGPLKQTSLKFINDSSDTIMS
jgi:hypothetical protein